MRNNSKKTIEVYTPFFKEFVKSFGGKDISKLAYYEINDYVQYKIKKENYKLEQQKQFISAIKYYYEKILNREKIYFNIGHENQIENHKLFLSLSEILKITKEITDTKRILLFIFHFTFETNCKQISVITLKESKKLINDAFKKYPNKKNVLLQLIKKYYKQYQPKKYFFEYESQNYSSEKIKSVILNTCTKHKLTCIYKADYILICNKLNLSESSQKNYLSYFLTFLKNFEFAHPLTITNEQIRIFLLDKSKNGYSKNTINQYINSIKLYYEKAYNREIPKTYIFRPKVEKKLPTILNYIEIQKIIQSIDNIKHKTLLLLTYSGGLRRSETLNLKIENIDFVRNEIHIVCAKGKKDRMIMLSHTIKYLLSEYIKQYNPQNYLFEGATGGRYSTSSFAKILKNAVEKANIKKKVTLHTLRHSFATHLFEQGTDIRIIQELLGHKDIKTTLRYVQVAKKELRKITSPLDNINISINKNTSNPSP